MSNDEPTDPNAPAEPPAEVEGTLEPAPLEPEAEANNERSGAKPEAPPPDYREIRIQTLERALADREATLHSYIRAHKKAEADFDAYKLRLERDRERELTAAKAKLVERLLEVADNLERTLVAAERGQGGGDGLVTGVAMAHRQFVERLTELGLERVDPTGKPFDPSSMEALGVVAVDDPAQNDRVALTMRVGYRLGDTELRPALVQVGRFFMS